MWVRCIKCHWTAAFKGDLPTRYGIEQWIGWHYISQRDLRLFTICWASHAVLLVLTADYHWGMEFSSPVDFCEWYLEFMLPTLPMGLFRSGGKMVAICIMQRLTNCIHTGVSTAQNPNSGWSSGFNKNFASGFLRCCKCGIFQRRADITSWYWRPAVIRLIMPFQATQIEKKRFALRFGKDQYLIPTETYTTLLFLNAWIEISLKVFSMPLWVQNNSSAGIVGVVPSRLD